MKILILVLLCSTASAEEFTFKFDLGGKRLVLKEDTKNWETAFSEAADKCYDFYRFEISSSHEYLSDIIDTCANPR